MEQLFSIVAMWLGIGFIFLVITLIKLALQKELKEEFFDDTWITFSICIILFGPIGPAIITRDYIQQKGKLKNSERNNDR